MTLRGPEPLAPNHALDGFDCGRPSLNDWLIRLARQAGASGSARTFVIANDDDAVVGYYSLTVGQVDSWEAPARFRAGMGQYPLPVIVLARLAVARAHVGTGLGGVLLRDAIRRTVRIAESAGVRAILTHPLDASAARFYLRFGFVASPGGDDTLLLLLKDARRMVREG